MNDGFVLIVALAVLAIVAILGGVAIFRWRRGLFEDSETGGSAWSLDSLERLRESGQISEQEFKVLRQQTLDSFEASMRRTGDGRSTAAPDANDR